MTLKVTLFFTVPSAAEILPLTLALPGGTVEIVKVAEDVPARTVMVPVTLAAEFVLRICKYITSRLRRAQQAAPLQMPGRLFFYSP